MFDPWLQDANTTDHWVPGHIDTLEPGPELAVFLEAVDVAQLTGHDQVRVLKARQRMASHQRAQIYRDMAAIADTMIDIGELPEYAGDLAGAEVRAALHLTSQAADSEVAFALELGDRYTMVRDLFDRGLIDQRRAKTIVHETRHLDDHIVFAIVDQVIEDAPRLTTGQLRARIRKVCAGIEPDAAKKRYETAVEERRIFTEPTGSGTANLLGLDLPPHLVSAATRRVNTIARSLRVKGESRTMDQLRADAFLDLLLGEENNGKGAVVQLNVDLDTLAELNDNTGELGGFGPVIADVARQVADNQHKAEWRFVITDSDTGLPVAGGTTCRRPTAEMRRRVEMRDQHCVFPGCRMPATDCDLDHRIDWAKGGPTSEANLAPDCERDHTIKHAGPWKCEPIGHGDYLWTSPLGHRYTTSGHDPPDT